MLRSPIHLQFLIQNLFVSHFYNFRTVSTYIKQGTFRGVQTRFFRLLRAKYETVALCVLCDCSLMLPFGFGSVLFPPLSAALRGIVANLFEGGERAVFIPL